LGRIAKIVTGEIEDTKAAPKMRAVVEQEWPDKLPPARPQ
jgi:hypothetical protein